ncbi:MAG TPA: ABC transporter ATP-binding protein [Candidatus Dormibacteraeota bacterium]|nr:ABC transporter ATP-binding protein [Candidatus Dormibacteraeota bacterium]
MRLIGPGVIRQRDLAHRKVTRLGSAIRLEGINHWYGSGRTHVQALCDIALDIPAGGYVALTGPSGAGKSTLLSLVGGLERPQSGRLRVGDQDLARLDSDRLAAYRRTTVGFVFQHFGLLDLLSARENIELAESLSAIPAKLRRAHADELLSEVGLTDRAHHRPGELSGGERQRVAIARALVNDPGLILADEPTGNLDAGSAMRILDLLESVHVERGCTLVVVTHNEAVAQRADRRYRMEAGRVLP